MAIAPFFFFLFTANNNVMQPNINEYKENKAVDYIESFKTIQTLYPLNPVAQERILSQGFTFEQVQNFLDTVDLDAAMLCFILNISGFHLAKIFREKCFSKAMCINILTIAEIYAHGYQVFKSRKTFNSWMKIEGRT